MPRGLKGEKKWGQSNVLSFGATLSGDWKSLPLGKQHLFCDEQFFFSNVYSSFKILILSIP
jgi:hypothetical protein